MTISVPKCAVLATTTDCPDFWEPGVLIPRVSRYRDLGVNLTFATLDFSDHIAELLLAASRLTNTIMRCFVIKEPSFYIKLYQALIVPRLTYCCEIWRPYLKKDK